MYNTTLTDHLIAFLFSHRSSKTYFQILNNRAWSRRNGQTIRTTLYRLKKEGLVELNNNAWRLTTKGRARGTDIERYGFISSPFSSKSPDKIVVSFDISESMRYERKWLRDQLKIFGYRMLHQSLWIGPGPLPDEFHKKILAIGIKNCIKFFTKK
ncbi:MAG: hypothetical protein WD963_00815 [Candidatus Paceibacterota bacterium]